MLSYAAVALCDEYMCNDDFGLVLYLTAILCVVDSVFSLQAWKSLSLQQSVSFLNFKNLLSILGK